MNDTKILTGIPKETRFQGIDIIKFIMAIFVVAVHSQLSLATHGFLKNVLDILFDTSVIYFFIASGYFIGSYFVYQNKCYTEKSFRKVKSSFFKIAKMYLIWCAVYLPLSIFGEIYYGNGLIKSAVKIFRGLFFAGQNFYSYQLWYLLAFAVALALLLIFMKLKIRYRYITVIAVILFLIGILLDYLHTSGYDSFVLNAYFAVFTNTKNGFFKGLFYLIIGISIYKSGKITKPIFSVIIAAAVFIVTAVVNNDSLTALLLPVCSAFIFCLALSIKPGVISDSLSLNLRNMSTGIYFLHMYFVAIFIVGISHGSEQYNYPLCTLFSVAASLVIYAILYLIKIKGKRLSSILMITN